MLIKKFFFNYIKLEYIFRTDLVKVVEFKMYTIAYNMIFTHYMFRITRGITIVDCACDIHIYIFIYLNINRRYAWNLEMYILYFILLRIIYYI